jgi:hypothetical protein
MTGAGARAALPAAAVAVALALAAAGCGGTSGKVLERIDPATPPGSNLRLDVLVVRALSTCVVGNPCTSSDASQCYYVTDAAGARTTFDAGSVELVPPSDPRVASAPQSRCLTLTIDDTQAAAVNDLMTGLRTRVFQLTGGDINIEVHTHDIAAVDAAFMRYSVGPFLPPSALEAVGLADVTRDTDFAFAVTGYRDATSGLAPKLDPCSGTNWIDQGSFGGSTFTWLALADACARASVVMRAWVVQFYFGLRDVTGFGSTATGTFPPCGRGGADPTAWFPWVDDCTTDPDVATCGDASCPDYDSFDGHILSAHWTRGRAFNGNYCSDGRMDFDETGVDSGGLCDLLGR